MVRTVEAKTDVCSKFPSSGQGNAVALDTDGFTFGMILMGFQFLARDRCGKSKWMTSSLTDDNERP